MPGSELPISCCKKTDSTNSTLTKDPSWNPNQQPSGYTERMLMLRPELALVTRFEIPAKPVFSGRPKHEIWCDLSSDGVHFDTVSVRMNPLWANPEHEFHFVGKRPWFLDKKVDAPFGRMTAKQRSDSSLKF
jgi:hypothetical protein